MSEVEVSRCKRIGEMNPGQLKQTTIDPKTRSMLRVTLPGQYEDRQPIKDLVERLMGRDPAPRFEFIRNERRTSRRRQATMKPTRPPPAPPSSPKTRP
jgi:topoisomerase-4 subunit B